MAPAGLRISNHQHSGNQMNSNTSEPTQASFGLKKIETIPLDAIEIPDTHRSVNADIVKMLAESMKKVGLLSPILVREPIKDGAPAILIAGRHRLEAAKI